jgi:hypothetical protein
VINPNTEVSYVFHGLVDDICLSWLSTAAAFLCLIQLIAMKRIMFDSGFAELAAEVTVMKRRSIGGVIIVLRGV